jgi:hypothetical protein
MSRRGSAMVLGAYQWGCRFGQPVAAALAAPDALDHNVDAGQIHSLFIHTGRNGSFPCVKFVFLVIPRSHGAPISFQILSTEAGVVTLLGFKAQMAEKSSKKAENICKNGNLFFLIDFQKSCFLTLDNGGYHAETYFINIDIYDLHM